MTNMEIGLALRRMKQQWGDPDTHNYSVRIFLDSGATVFAYKWDLDEEDNGLLHISVPGSGDAPSREALIAVSHIILIEKVPTLL